MAHTNPLAASEKLSLGQTSQVRALCEEVLDQSASKIHVAVNGRGAKTLLHLADNTDRTRIVLEMPFIELLPTDKEEDHTPSGEDVSDSQGTEAEPLSGKGARFILSRARYSSVPELNWKVHVPADLDERATVEYLPGLRGQAVVEDMFRTLGKVARED